MSRPQESPWAFDVSPLLAAPGERLHIDGAFPAPSGIGDEVIGVREGDPVRLVGDFDAIVDGLVLTANISAPIHACCVRCLKPIEKTWDTNVTAFFPYEANIPDDALTHNKQPFVEVEVLAGQDEAEDIYPLSEDGSYAALENLLRDTLVELLPVKPLCRPDCKGLCPQCGVNLNEHPEHHHDITDNRFARLAQLKAELEQQERTQQ